MDVLELKRLMRKETNYLTSGWDQVDMAYLEERIRGYLESWKKNQSVDIDPDVEALATKQLCDDFTGFGPIRDLLEDTTVTEIMINGPENIFVEQNGRSVQSSAAFDDNAHLEYVVSHMIEHSGRRVDQASPCADFSLSDGSRVNVTIPPLSVGSTTVTIRKLTQAIDSLDALAAFGTLDARMANFLVDCMNGGVNMLFCGATGTGKTTTINILSQYIKDSGRIITIEDTLELGLGQGNVVRLLTRPADIHGQGEISMRFLFTNALRMRPSRLILGEIRGPEAMEYIQAVNSGHEGTLAVLHAATPKDAVSRLETMALYSGLQLPIWSIRNQIASGVDLIIQHAQLPDGSRKITHITELLGMDKDEVVLKDIFRYETEETDDPEKVQGKFVAFDPPSFFVELRKRGVHMNADIFQN
ncbi:MAG: pilus assembly protein CpaF [Candidatus Promineifilaceae bacterium]|jgi:pilus assembly protein CpaF